MRFITIVLGLCVSTMAWAQGGTLDQNMGDMFAELEGGVVLRFTDAVSGKPIPGADVTLGAQVGRTDAEGAVRFSKPADLGDDDRRKVVFKKAGYVTSTVKVHFMMGAVFFNRFSISPALPPGRIRMVLDWGAKPTDLDAHLVKKGVYHLSYRQMRKYQDRAWLDRDDRDGHGPETITVLSLDANATYSFYVHDYTRSGRIGDSQAHVRVFSSNGVEQSYVVPRGAKGDTWSVFEVHQGVIKPVNTTR